MRASDAIFAPTLGLQISKIKRAEAALPESFDRRLTRKFANTKLTCLTLICGVTTRQPYPKPPHAIMRFDFPAPIRMTDGSKLSI